MGCSPPALFRHNPSSRCARSRAPAKRSWRHGRGRSAGCEMLLEGATIKLAAVASDVLGKSGRAMLEALLAGEQDPAVLAELARGRMRVVSAPTAAGSGGATHGPAPNGAQAAVGAHRLVFCSRQLCWKPRSS